MAAAMLAACATQSVPSMQTALPTDDAVFPPVCTAPKIKSGDEVTSITAVGHLGRRTFVVRQPSTWTKVEWLKAPPPAARQAYAHSTRQAFVEYWGTYTLSDKTQGCQAGSHRRFAGDDRDADDYGCNGSSFALTERVAAAFARLFK